MIVRGRVLFGDGFIRGAVRQGWLGEGRSGGLGGVSLNKFFVFVKIKSKYSKGVFII